MKTNPNDFINAIDDEATCTYYGLTKREYFAAMAMQGALAASVGGMFNKTDHSYFSEHSVKFADALIEELNKEASGEN